MVRIPDARLLWVYMFVVVCMTFFGFLLGAQQERLVTVCRTTAVANINFNRALDALLSNAAQSKVLTQAQKAERDAQYAPLHLTVPSCPHSLF